ncbi:hypothetical protein AAMO2058_000112900 [Amorphochlora amoebiformis]
MARVSHNSSNSFPKEAVKGDDDTKRKAISMGVMMRAKYNLTPYHASLLTSRIEDMFYQRHGEFEELEKEIKDRYWDLLAGLNVTGSNIGNSYKARWVAGRGNERRICEEVTGGLKVRIPHENVRRIISEYSFDGVFTVDVYSLNDDDENPIQQQEELTRAQWDIWNIVRTKELWVATELFEGKTVKDLIKTKPFSETQIAIVCREVLTGLAYLQGGTQVTCIHGDIKSSNIVVGSDGSVKMLRFGLIRAIRNLSEYSLVSDAGAWRWLPPEIINGDSEKCRSNFPSSDIWSLGCTCVEMISGFPPYYNLRVPEGLRKILKGEMPTLPEGVSREFEQFAKACFVLDPLKRPGASALLKLPFVSNSGTQLLPRDLTETETVASRERRYDSVASP